MTLQCLVNATIAYYISSERSISDLFEYTAYSVTLYKDLLKFASFSPVKSQYLNTRPK